VVDYVKQQTVSVRDGKWKENLLFV